MTQWVRKTITRLVRWLKPKPAPGLPPIPLFAATSDGFPVWSDSVSACLIVPRAIVQRATASLDHWTDGACSHCGYALRASDSLNVWSDSVSLEMPHPEIGPGVRLVTKFPFIAQTRKMLAPDPHPVCPHCGQVM